MRILAMALVASMSVAAFAGFATVAGTLLSMGIPVFMSGDPVLGDDRDLLVEWSHQLPVVIPPALGAALLSSLLLWLLVWSVAPHARLPVDAMLDEFQRRVKDQEPGGTPARRRMDDLGPIVVITLVPVGFVATWLGFAYLGNFDPVPHGIEWITMPIVTVALMSFIAVCGWLLLALSRHVVRYFVRPLGIRAADIEALETAALEQRLAVALLRWPEDGEPWRSNAAVSVLASDLPPKPFGSDRHLEVPWAPNGTGVEVLAGTLLAAAALDCQQRGLLELRREAGQMFLVAYLPKDVRPEGLARIVLGHRRFGLDRGRVVAGTIARTVESWIPHGDEDPHWAVIEIALEDLRHQGFLLDGSLDLRALTSAARATPADHPASSDGDAPKKRDLAAEWARALGKLRTVDAGEGVTAVVGLVGNRNERAARRLPDQRAGL